MSSAPATRSCTRNARGGAVRFQRTFIGREFARIYLEAMAKLAAGE